MKVFTRIEPLQAFLDDQRSGGSSIGLVPTMGALHKGHISLIDASRKNGDFTVCSLFVNPAQFNDPKDLEAYPRDLEADKKLLKAAGGRVLFAPDVSEMYERDHQLRFEFGNLGRVLEGAFRPGHFSGVALVVSKLFNIVRPKHAYFGCKDYQQFRIISLLNQEMKFGITLHGLPTIREHDGLAMSSRNLRLTSEERKVAPVIFANLQTARASLLAGESWQNVQNQARKNLAASHVQLDYFELADKVTLEKAQTATNGILLVAAFIGKIRLIDNLPLAE